MQPTLALPRPLPLLQDSARNSKPDTLCGTPAYVAPEVLKGGAVRPAGASPGMGCTTGALPHTTAAGSTSSFC